MQYELLKVARRCKAYLSNVAFPFWNAHGFINAEHGFVESFDLKTGKPNLDHDRRLRVQARQIWVFAKASGLNLGQNSLQLAKDAWNVVQTQYRHADGGYIFSVDKDGKPVGKERNFYEQSFVLLALSALYGATNDKKYLDEAEKLYAWLNENMKADDGFWTQFDDKTLPREQNPHMHLFEALIALFEVSKQRHWLMRASEIYGMFHNFFFDAENRLLREFFSLGFSGYDLEKGDIIEPGHNYEWTWLLHHFGQMTGFSSEYQDELYAFALDGTTEEGFGLDQCSPDGDILSHTSRLWVQTEALKAHIAQYERHRDVEQVEAIVTTVNNIFDYYLRLDGLWGDRLDRNLNEMSKVCPASTFYHLFLAMLELMRVAGNDLKDR